MVGHGVSLVADEVEPLLNPVRIVLQVLVLWHSLVDVENNLLKVLNRCFSVLQKVGVVDWDLGILEIAQLLVNIQLTIVVGRPRHIERFVERLTALSRVVKNRRFVNPITQTAHILLV